MLNPYIDRIKDKISSYRANDFYASLDYGYTYSDFLLSYDKPLGSHVKAGLKEYIALRSTSAKNQVQNTAISPIIEDQKVTWNNNSCKLSCSIHALSQTTVTAYHRLNNGNWSSRVLFDDGQNPDQKAGDGYFVYDFFYNGKTVADIYITAKDGSGRVSRWPVCDYYTIDLGYENVALLVVNEFMADNTTIKNNAGEYEDWIEI